MTAEKYQMFRRRQHESGRDNIRAEVATILTSGASKGKNSTMTAEKAQLIAIYLEQILYLGATSYSEYSNLETLRDRLRKVAAEYRSNRDHDIQETSERTRFKQQTPRFQETKVEPVNPVFFSPSYVDQDSHTISICPKKSRNVYHVQVNN